MQELQFETAWERTISKQDRQLIEMIFRSAKHEESKITFIREAINHEGALLVTVLIHNRESTDLSIENEWITYTNAASETWGGQFTLPFAIPKYTSMPWTFIFTEKNDSEKEPFYPISHQ